MIRGYNSFIYYVKRSGDTDDVVIAMKLNKISKQW